NRKNVPISSIMLGTIDRATLPRSDFTAGKYLNASGDIIPKYFAKVSEPSDFIIGRGIVKNDGKNRQIQISWVPKGTHFEMVIQARFHNLLAATDKIEEVLEGLHVESNETFERIISDEMRLSVMGGSSAV
ncbi:MAG: hypothetical protein U1E10_07180, partial [Bdellovibrionales bacterium]|nr:hypothetical protein [Bdellovibrionales bacterium]